VVFLYWQVDRKDGARASTEYNYVRVKVLTEEGRNVANVEIPYLKEKVNISGVRAEPSGPTARSPISTASYLTR